MSKYKDEDIILDDEDIEIAETPICIYLTDDNKCSDGCISENLEASAKCPFLDVGYELCPCFETYDELESSEEDDTDSFPDD